MEKKDGNKSPSFAEVLGREIENLKKDKNFGGEGELAKRAGIDPTIFSQLKKPGNERAAKNRDYRLQLATVMRKSLQDIFDLAREFVQATPELKIDDYELKERLKILTIKLLQNEIKKIEIGLPLFFDTAPFLVAEKYGYFKKLNLNVQLDYVKWAKTLAYLNLDADTDTPKTGNEDLDDSEKQREINENNELRLVIYNRESILTEKKQESTVFCFPIGIYKPVNFALWGREYIDKKISWQDKLKRLAKEPELRVIVSGEDMKLGVIKAFSKARESVNDDCFIVLDQFDGAEVFLSGLGHAWVGGVPQRIIAKTQNVQVLVSGDDINLVSQYNGIVCQKKALEDKSRRNAVIQILWAWYQAINKINHSLQSEADYIVQKMNIYAGQLKYEAQDFIDFWEGTKTKFVLPDSPLKMIEEIYSSNDYSYRLYDWTNYFADSLKDINEVFTNNRDVVQKANI